MASEMSKMLKKAVQEYTDEIAQKENKKIQTALNNTMKQIEEEVTKYLELMSDAYYDGYDPIAYIRTMQLKREDTRPYRPHTELTQTGNITNLGFGVIFNEDSMNHSSYTIKARWYDKKNKKWKDVKKRATYTVTPGKKTGNKVLESKILEFFQEGIHPNAVPEGWTEFPTPSPLFDDNMEGAIPELIDEWVESGALQKIFNNELRKLI